jgi:hypothetical protein
MCAPIGIIKEVVSEWKDCYSTSNLSQARVREIAKKYDSGFEVIYKEIKDEKIDELMDEMINEIKGNYYGVYLFWPESKRAIMEQHSQERESKVKPKYMDYWECITDKLYNKTKLCICEFIPKENNEKKIVVILTHPLKNIQKRGI